MSYKYYLTSQDVAKLSHKRTFSKTDHPGQLVAEGFLIPPSAKKAKSDAPDTLSAPDSKNELESFLTDCDGEDLVSLTPDGPNVFYGYTDTLFELFETGEENSDGLWPKAKVMHAYGALAENEDIDRMACVSISCDPEDLDSPEAKVLHDCFKVAGGNLWFEVTITRHLPADAPKKLRVELESGYYDMMSGVGGGKSLGEWWISDISVAEGESEKAITTIIRRIM